MSAKDKAIELVTKYAKLDFGCNDNIVFSKMHKKQALIAVDEIFNSGLLVMIDDEQYWYDVKQEIQLL